MMKKEKLTLNKFNQEVQWRYLKEWGFRKKAGDGEELKMMNITPICKDCFNFVALQMT